MVRFSLYKTLTGMCVLASTMSTGAVRAESPAPLSSQETTLTPAEIKKAVGMQTPVDSAVSILNAIKPKSVAGVSAAPAATIQDRMAMAGQQLLDDIGRSAAISLGTAGGPSEPGPSDVSVEKSKEFAETVFGTDDRTKVTATTSTPYKAVCQIQITWPNGSTGTATAEFVSPRVLLTNAHCTYMPANGGWARSVKIVPGKNGTSEPFGSQFAMTYYVPTAWINSKPSPTSVNPDFDISWLIMPDRTLFNRTGYAFGYQTTSDANLKTYQLNMAGYPNDKKSGSGKDGKNMWFQYGGGNQSVSANQYRHYLDTNPGSSGSPMWLYFSSGATPGRFVVGVNDAENSSSNFATRMTTTYFNNTKNFTTQFP